MTRTSMCLPSGPEERHLGGGCCPGPLGLEPPALTAVWTEDGALPLLPQEGFRGRGHSWCGLDNGTSHPRLSEDPKPQCVPSEFISCQRSPHSRPSLLPVTSKEMWPPHPLGGDQARGPLGLALQGPQGTCLWRELLRQSWFAPQAPPSAPTSTVLSPRGPCLGGCPQASLG